MKDNVIQEFMESIKTDPEKKQQVYSATVSRIDSEGTVWVFVAGSNKETPTASTSASVKSGDVVNVMWQNNKLYIAGNYTDPSSGIAKVRQVEQAANTAREAANNAVVDAGRAREAAEEAESTANSVRGIAVDAQTNAGIAKTAADKAVKDLSQVENVVGVVNWIAEHGTMTSQQGEAFDSSKVYFVVDPNGDYHIGSTHYSVVQNPVAEDIDSYYLLSIEESVQNYVTTHLYVDSEGLWVLPEGLSANSYKVLIATGGQGHLYEDAGTYIIDAAGKTVAKLGEVITLGIDDGTQSYMEFDYHSIQMTDKEGNVFFHISDLRDKSGEAVITDVFKADGTTRTFNLSSIATTTSYQVVVRDADEYNITKDFARFTFDRPPAPGKRITATYSTRSKHCKAYTFGTRVDNVSIGLYSFAEGYRVAAEGKNSHAEGAYTDAVGQYSHAEGYYTGAVGRYSHAEGYYTGAYGKSSHSEGTESRANGYASHAQNTGTIAANDSQTAIGKYNEKDTESDPQKQKAFIIGNGTDEDNRSNAFTVDWEGNTKAYGEIEDGSGNSLSNKADKSELPPLPETGTITAGTVTWKYKKYADGSLEMWGSGNTTLAISTPSGNLFTTANEYDIAMPSFVSAIDFITAELSGAGWADITGFSVPPKLRLYAPTSFGSANRVLRYYLRGSWN